MEKNEYRRIIRLQKQILRSIRADVRKTLGRQTKDIQRYYTQYKKEFTTSFKASTPEELMDRSIVSDLIFVGDYHTFKRSQQTALKILEGLSTDPEHSLIVGLELFSSDKQPVLDEMWEQSLSNAPLDEEKLLKSVEYEKLWGFPWKNYRELVYFCYEKKIRILGLNLYSKSLEERDRHAAKVLADVLSETHGSNTKLKILTLYGDLHLAKRHLPKKVSLELKNRELKRKTLVVFQNSETLYWKMPDSKTSLTSSVLKLGGNRFCIMNAPPWMKLQSFLDWNESEALFNLEENSSLYEQTHVHIHRLSEALGFAEISPIDFHVLTLDGLDQWKSLSNGMSKAESKAIKFLILTNRAFFWGKQNLIYLPPESTNASSEIASLLLHHKQSQSETVFTDPKTQFHQAILSYCIAYFGSKILNPKRKCDLEEDLKKHLELPLRPKALLEEKIQRKSDRIILAQCDAQIHFLKTGKQTRSPYRRMEGPSRMALFLNTVRGLGFLLGEKLYRGFLDGRIDLSFIQNLYHTNFNSEARSRLIYHETLLKLDVQGLEQSTKKDYF